MFKKILPQSTFAKNTLILLIGTSVAQAIPIAISPILTRIYSPEDFGVFTFFFSISSLIGVIATARYEMAIMIPKEKDDAVNILAFSSFIALALGVITFLFSIIFFEPFSQLFFKQTHSLYVYLIPIMITILGLYQAFNYWSSRNKTFIKNSISRVSIALVTAIVSLSFGFYTKGPSGLIIGLIIGQFVGVIILVWGNIKEWKYFMSVINLNKMKELIIKHKDFPLFNSFHAFLDILHNNIIIFFLDHYFLKSIVGYYGFTFRILKGPVGLIGSSTSQVFYQQAAIEAHERKNLSSRMWDIHKKLLIIGIPIFAIIAIFSPMVFSFIYGKEWKIAGDVARIISPWLFLNFLTSPVSTITLIANKQRQAVFLIIVDILLKVIGMFIAGIYGSYYLFFVLITISSSCVLLFTLWWYYKIAKRF